MVFTFGPQFQKLLYDFYPDSLDQRKNIRNIGDSSNQLKVAHCEILVII